MDIVELINSIQVEFEMAEKERDKATAEVKYILGKCAQEGRATLTDDEDARVKELFSTRDRRNADLVGIKAKLDAAKRAQVAELETEEAARNRTTVDGLPRSYDQVARVGNEERTYHKGNDRTGAAFLRDISKQFLFRDPEAEHRLVRHMQEERVERAKYLQRAVGTGAFVGLTVPQYLTDMYAPAIANLRPFADICNKHELPPDGMTVNISRITTASGVTLQATQNTAIQNTDMADTLLTENVQTAAGQQTLSRQAIDRGTGIEEVVMSDLFRRYATTLDNTLINQATTGLDAVSSTNTWTTASPTADLAYSKIVGATANVEAALLGQAIPSHAIMHSRRWYWLTAELTANHPFAANSFSQWNAVMNNNVGYNQGARGILPNGLQAIVDNNVVTNLGAGTNQDRLYVISNTECHLWEDPQAPAFIRAEQPAAASLGVLLVLYGYFAYSFRRYANAVQNMDGTGLVTPVF